MLLDKLRDEAHLWFIKPESIDNGDVLDACLKVLSAQEHERHRRFRFAADRHRYLVSHAFVRNVLSNYAAIPPDAWVFSETDRGKPFVTNPGLATIRFSLSHTEGLSACLVTSGCDCGVDVEKLHVRHDPVGVAERMFSEPEVAQMRQLNGREQLEFFFERWTLREAYTKARGIGITFPTRKLNFRIRSEGEVGIEFEAGIDEKPEDWQLEILSPTDEHLAAAAIHRPDRASQTIIRYNMREDMTSWQTMAPGSMIVQESSSMAS